METPPDAASIACRKKESERKTYHKNGSVLKLEKFRVRVASKQDYLPPRKMAYRELFHHTRRRWENKITLEENNTYRIEMLECILCKLFPRKLNKSSILIHIRCYHQDNLCIIHIESEWERDAPLYSTQKSIILLLLLVRISNIVRLFYIYNDFPLYTFSLSLSLWALLHYPRKKYSFLYNAKTITLFNTAATKWHTEREAQQHSCCEHDLRYERERETKRIAKLNE